MQSFDKQKLSGSTDGLGIKVVETSTPGTTVHTAVTGTSDYDEAYVYAFNSHTADVLLTVEFGGATDPDNIIEYTVPFQQGMFLVVPGFVLQNEKVIAAFAGTTNVVTLYGYIHRISK